MGRVALSSNYRLPPEPGTSKGSLLYNSQRPVGPKLRSELYLEFLSCAYRIWPCPPHRLTHPTKAEGGKEYHAIEVEGEALRFFLVSACKDFPK